MQPGRRPERLNLVPYTICRDWIQTGDVALSAADGHGVGEIVTDQIKRITDSDYPHAMMLGWMCDSRVAALSESTTPRSCTVPFRQRVKEQSGEIDVYRVRPDYYASPSRFSVAWEFMFRAGDKDYPEEVLFHYWATSLREKLTIGGRTYLPDVKHYPNASTPEEFSGVCSQLVHAALRVDGMPPIRECDCDVAPGTLADPERLEYQFTPIWSS